MCVVSNVGDDWTRRLDPWKDQQWPTPLPGTIPYPGPVVAPAPYDTPSRKEFDELKKQVEQMKKELEAAKAQDIAEGNPDCEMEEKVELLKRIAKLVGVDLSTVWPDDDEEK